jgi:hypothetical protein
MTYQLAALRFRSVGERSARFTDLTIDLTAPASDGHVPQDSVIWLRNGGGKSSILSLLYALLLPHANDFMGRAVKRSLTDYVDSGDTSHVVAVWVPGPGSPRPHEALITGVVYEWTDLRRPAQPSESRDRLLTSFYASHVVPGQLDLATLPFSDAFGRPLRLTRFLEALRELARPVFQQTGLVITDKQHGWTTALRARHLDPEIFRTQKQMNHVEGGVEDLFRFAAAKDFIDFLLDLTTQPEAPASVAKRLGDVEGLLAAKPAKISEQDFCIAAATELDAVAARHQEAEAAAAELTVASAAAAELATAFASAIIVAETAYENLATEREAVASARTAASNERSQAGDLQYLYRREAARLRLRDAERAEQEAIHQAAQTSALARAWEVAQHLAVLAEERGALELARQAAAAEESELAPLRADHACHAARLRARLEELAEEADFAADLADEQQQDVEETARCEAEFVRQARDELGQATADESQARTRLEIFGQRRADGVRDGHLPAVDAAPDEHVQIARDRRSELQAELDGLVRAIEARRQRRTWIIERERELAATSNEADGQRAKAAASHAALNGRLTDLLGNDRIRELVEAAADEPIDLWAEAQVIQRRLSDAIIKVDDERISRRAEVHADRRAIEAQERNQYLPSSLDAERLERALAPGVTTQTGWEYLRSRLPADQLRPALDRAAIARLGCGVVIPTHSADDAIRALSGRDVRTTSLVGVYTAEAADRLLSSGGSDQVSPVWTGLEPGLVDPEEAEAAVRQLKERADEYRRKDQELARHREADDELRRDTAQFIADCPPGHLDALWLEIERLDDQLRAIHDEQQADKNELHQLDDADRDDEAMRGEIQGKQSKLDVTIAWLAALIVDLREEPVWQDRLDDAARRGKKAGDRAEEHEREQLTATALALTLAATARTERGKAEGYRSEGAGVPDSSGFDQITVDPGTPLDTLRRNHSDALQTLQNRAAQSVLADRVVQATNRVTTAEKVLARFPETDRTAAPRLLASPDGQEPYLRQAALESARRADRAAAESKGNATGIVSQRRGELTDIERSRDTPPRRTLPLTPMSAVEADDLAVEQERRSGELFERITRADNQIKEIDGQSERIKTRQRLLSTLLDSLPAPFANGVAIEPFPGTEEDAREQARTIRERVDVAEAKATETDSLLKTAVDQLRRVASRFSTIGGPIKDRVVNDPISVLGPGAADIAAKLRLRAQTLADELMSIAKDQLILSEGLAHLVKESLDLLAQAERGSQMDTASGSWAGRRILRIGFDRPDDADLVVYAERVIDQIIQKGLKPEGMPMLKAAVHEAAGPRGFTVKVLKPSDDASATTEDISRLAKWSGGEKLTVCVALYCTLAALRAAQTGRSPRSGGVLLLDNPIGRASTPYLVRLQRDVAASHGVQLVVTTGVKDPAAVIQFPNVVRLDNREGRTHNRRYVVADDGESPSGEVTGVRVAHADHRWGADAAGQDQAS